MASDYDTPARGASDRRRLMPSQYLALLAGVIFLALGIAGFFVTGFEDFADAHTGEELLGFELNGMHNVVHIALGVLGLGLFMSVRGSLAYGIITAIGYGATFVFGLFALDEDWNFLSLNDADNWLHLGLTMLGVVIAALAAYELRELRGVRSTDRSRDVGAPAAGRRRPA